VRDPSRACAGGRPSQGVKTLVTPYLGEIKLFAGTVVPRGWHLCDGTLLSIQQNTALFSLIGTTYGGNGQTNFALPDFRGRVATGAGSTYPLGTVAGVPSVTLNTGQMPQHNHLVNAKTTAGNTTGVVNVVYAQVTSPSPQNLYAPWGGTEITLETGNLAMVGGSLPHDNTQPSLGLQFYIALQGIYPSRP